MDDKERAINTIRKLVERRAEKKAKEMARKNETLRETEETIEESPSLRTLGALSLMLAKRKALEAEKKFRVGEDSKIRVKGEYDPYTKEKRLGLFYDKEF